MFKHSPGPNLTDPDTATRGSFSCNLRLNPSQSRGVFTKSIYDIYKNIS